MCALPYTHSHAYRDGFCYHVALWPFGLVFVWKLHDWKHFVRVKCAYTYTHIHINTIPLSISSFVNFNFSFPHLFSQVGSGALLEMPQWVMFNLSLPPFHLRCQWWWWNQLLRPFERHRPTRMESAASAANQTEGEVERAGPMETLMERSARLTYCTCNSNRCVYAFMSVRACVPLAPSDCACFWTFCELLCARNAFVWHYVYRHVLQSLAQLMSIVYNSCVKRYGAARTRPLCNILSWPY